MACGLLMVWLHSGAPSAMAEESRDAIVPYVRTGMAVELAIPDTSIEVGIDDKDLGATLGWPLILRLLHADFGHHTSRKHSFVLAVIEPQLALGRKHAYRLRGLASFRVGSGLYNQRISTYLEAGYNVSQHAPESGGVLGVGVGYLPHHLISLSLLTRYYAGEERRVSTTLDLSIPLQLWNP